MLQRQPRAFDLARFGRATQLSRQLEALRETRGAERMALGQQPARWIGDDLAAVGVVASGDELRRRAGRAKAERLVGDQLVVREAVVQLADIDVVRTDSRRFVHRIGGGLRHVGSRPG